MAGAIGRAATLGHATTALCCRFRRSCSVCLGDGAAAAAAAADAICFQVEDDPLKYVAGNHHLLNMRALNALSPNFHVALGQVSCCCKSQPQPALSPPPPPSLPPPPPTFPPPPPTPAHHTCPQIGRFVLQPGARIASLLLPLSNYISRSGHRHIIRRV